MATTIKKEKLKDIEILANHHNLMFEEISFLLGKEISLSMLNSMYESSIKKLITS